MQKNYSVDVRLNKKYFEKIVINNIYDRKENKIINKANINSTSNKLNNINNKTEKCESNYIKQTQSNKVLHNKNIFELNINSKNRKNRVIYDKNTESLRNYHNKLYNKNIKKYNYNYNKNSNTQTYFQQKIIKTNENYCRLGHNKSHIYDYD